MFRTTRDIYDNGIEHRSGCQVKWMLRLGVRTVRTKNRRMTTARFYFSTISEGLIDVCVCVLKVVCVNALVPAFSAAFIQ